MGHIYVSGSDISLADIFFDHCWECTQNNSELYGMQLVVLVIKATLRKCNPRLSEFAINVRQ